LQEEQVRQLVAAIDKQGSALHTNLEEMAKLVGRSSAEMAQFLTQSQQQQKAQRSLAAQPPRVVVAPSNESDSDDDDSDDDNVNGERGYKLVPVRHQPAPRYNDTPAEQERSMDDSQSVDADDEEQLRRVRSAGLNYDPPIEYQLYLPLDASHHHLQLAGVGSRSSHKAKDHELQRFDPHNQQMTSIAFVGQGIGAGGAAQPSKPRSAWQAAVAPAAERAIERRPEARVAPVPPMLDEGGEKPTSHPFAPPDPFCAATSCRRDVMRAMISKVARTEGTPRSPEADEQPVEQREALPVDPPAAEPAPPDQRNYLVRGCANLLLLLCLDSSIAQPFARLVGRKAACPHANPGRAAGAHDGAAQNPVGEDRSSCCTSACTTTTDYRASTAADHSSSGD
jgi:hypothetical protein